MTPMHTLPWISKYADEILKQTPKIGDFGLHMKHENHVGL